MSASQNLQGLDHLPADIMSALVTYERDVEEGRITFGPSGYADTYPGQEKADASLASHIQAHTHFTS